LAFGLLFLIASEALGLYPQVSKPLLVLSVFSFLAATCLRIKMWRNATKDPYSLNKLNDIIREGTYIEDDIPEVDHDGDKFCLCCQTVYGAHFGTCPTCAKK
jgi:hypothetical protein